MPNTVNYIQNNRVLSWCIAIITGIMFYYGCIITRAVLRPIILAIPAEFFKDQKSVEIVWKVILFNCLEIVIVAIIVSVLTSLIIKFIFDKMANKYGLLSIASFILISILRLIPQITTIESNWIIYIKIIRPVLTGIILWAVLWKISKKEISPNK
ncbi:MAG: hypothetical protein FD174_1912 [Geobacteraceae bacterium]|nr:MAG: hypothetical protein FD174_1912 [Geobacteraceae bacterium]